MQDLSFTIAQLHARYADGLDPLAVVTEAYRRIEAVGDPGIFLHLIPEADAVAEARALGAFDLAAKPLWGIPFAVKDNIDVAGAPTTAACPAYAYEAEADAFVVARLREAGAILIGKTNLDQFATGLVGVRTPHPVPRNALDPAIVPGGSSAGSAVAVARGIVAFSLGTDTAGSGRVPAALNGIVGLKPSLGALSASGVVPACRTLDTISIFARIVDDAYRVFEASAVYDPADAYARHCSALPLGEALLTPRIAVPDEASRRFFGDAVQAEAFEAALTILRDMGARIVPIDFAPFYEVADLLYEGAWVAERYTVVEDLLKREPEALHPTTRAIIGAAEKLTAADAFRGLYRLAELRRDVEPLLGEVDALCVPSIPSFYTHADLEADPITPNSRLGTYTNFVNLLDLCAIATPAPPRSDGRPGSVTLIAAHGRDATIAALARGLAARSVPGAAGTAPIVEGVPPGHTALLAIGAHMSGLPLNGHLTERGGVFHRVAETAKAYRLYSLPGGPPRRPGLVRAEGGAAIMGEVWHIPTVRLGDFLTTIPAPLGLGTVTLADGSTCTGFLCEPYALAGATEITPHRSWRRYLEAQRLEMTSENWAAV